jgi:hypothetical protein
MFKKCKAFKAAEEKMHEQKEAYGRSMPRYKKMVAYGNENVVGRERRE